MAIIIREMILAESSLNEYVFVIRPFEKMGRIMEWRLCLSVRPSVNIKVLHLALVYILYDISKSLNARSMKL